MIDNILVIIVAFLTAVTLMLKEPPVPDVSAEGFAPMSKGKFRSVRTDPFRIITRVETPARPARPEITIRGIVADRNGGLVVIETRNGEPVLLKSGEAFQGVEIVEITPSFVVTRFDHKRDTVEIW